VYIIAELEYIGLRQMLQYTTRRKERHKKMEREKEREGEIKNVPVFLIHDLNIK
jgi:hypothetical protein